MFLESVHLHGGEKFYSYENTRPRELNVEFLLRRFQTRKNILFLLWDRKLNLDTDSYMLRAVRKEKKSKNGHSVPLYHIP